MSARRATPTGHPVQRAVMTEAALEAILARNYGDVRLPDAAVWTLAAGAVRNYQGRPWTNQDAGVMVAASRRMQEEREKLNQAAAILEADAKRAPPSFQSRYTEAIQMLRMPRGAADNRHDHVSKISAQGEAMRGWAYTARELMGWIVPVLFAAQVPVSSRYTSPLVKSMREILGFIYLQDELPAPTTLSKVVAEYLDR